MEASRPRTSDALSDYLSISDGAARAAWLASLRIRQPALADEVESLAAHVTKGGFLESPATPLSIGVDDDSSAVAGGMVGEYELLSQIGEGGFGLVFRARRTSDGDLSAVVKLLRESLLTSSARDRFTREQVVLQRLSHPGIARLRAAGTLEGGTPYLVMDYVRGIALTSFAERERLTLRDRVALVASILDAVGYAHQQGVAHRDLKPSNLLAFRGPGGEPQAVVIDFGIAKLVEEKPSGVTTTGQTLGTEAYSSPEQIRHASREVGLASDLFSLGVVFAELLTGRLPWRADSTGSFRDSILRDLPNVSEVADGLPIPAQLQAVLHKALRKDPADRFANAEDFAADLRRWLDGTKVRTRALSLHFRVQHFCRRYRTLVLAIIAVAAALLAGTAASLRFAFLANARSHALQNQQALAAMQGASQALRTGERVSARALLASVPPSHRNLPWSWLSSRAQPATLLASELGQVQSLAVGDGFVVLGTMGGKLHCVRSDGLRRWTIDGHTRPVTRAEVFTWDGRQYVVSVSSDGALLVVDAQSGETIRRVLVSSAGLSGLAIDVDAGAFLVGGEEGLFVVDADAPASAEARKLNALNVSSIATDGESTVVATRSGQLIALANGTFAEQWRTQLGQQWLTGCTILANMPRSLLAVSNVAGTVWLIDGQTGEVLDQLPLATGAAHALRWDSLSQSLVIAGRFGTLSVATVKLGRVPTLTADRSTRGHGSNVQAEIRGDRLFSASWSGELLVEQLGSQHRSLDQSVIAASPVAIGSEGSVAIVERSGKCLVISTVEEQPLTVSLPIERVGALAWAGRDARSSLVVLGEGKLCMGWTDGWECWPHTLTNATTLLAVNGDQFLVADNVQILLGARGQIPKVVTSAQVPTAVTVFGDAFAVAMSDRKVQSFATDGRADTLATFPETVSWLGACGRALVALNAKADTLYIVSGIKQTTFPLVKVQPSVCYAESDGTLVLLGYPDGTIMAVDIRTMGVVELNPPTSSQSWIALASSDDGKLVAVSAQGRVLVLTADQSK